MHKKFRKTAALILTAAMLLQSGIQGMAEEPQTGTVTQAPAEAPQTQAPTEAPQTQAPTEAPQTQAPTEAPQTQAPTEAPQTQAPTETPQTQAPTEAPQTQAPGETSQTQTSAQEEETQAPAKEKKEKEKETEASKLSDRKNSGEKVTADELVSKLGGALAYLFVADTVEAPETLLEGQALLQGSDGSSVLDGLAKQSVVLADARSSKDVKVINLYADENGRLDTAQLDEIYSDQVIDVTDQYFLVNVIADSADQALEFSGYDMKLSGNTVQYKKETQPGDILYNFAALDGDKFTEYKGTLTLKNGSGLQGAFLAPGADVHVDSSLAGSVFAGSVKVADTVESLLQIGFIDGIPAGGQGQGDSQEPESSQGQSDGRETEEGQGTEQAGTEEAGADNGLELNDPGDAQQTGSAQISFALYDTDGDLVTPASWQNTSFVLQYEKEGQTAYVQENGSPKIFRYQGPALTVEGLSLGVAYTLVQLTAEAGYQPAAQTTIHPGQAADSPAAYTLENRAAAADSKSLTMNVSAVYGGVSLNAADVFATGRYVALFKVNDDDNSLGARVGSIAELSYAKDQNVAAAVFDGLAPGTYRLQQVDALGSPLQTPDGDLALPVDDIIIQDTDVQNSVSGSLNFPAYPEGKFYYSGTVTVTKTVLDKDDNPLTPAAPFYANLYTDSALTTPVEAAPVFTFNFTDSNTVTASYTVKLTSASAEFYLAEVDANGTAVTSGSSDFGYEISIEPQTVTLSCEAGKTDASAAITNKALSQEPQPDPTVVRLGARNSSSGKYISGVKLLIKDSKGKLVLGKTFTSGKSIARLSDADVQKLTPGETYYLSEVTAPSGCAPAKDVKFTVTANQTTDVVLDHSAASSTNYQITASKQVYAGNSQVYANGTSSNHSFYVALFEDKEHIVKVSDVQKITMKGLTGSTVFKNVKHNSTYYVAETNANGIPKASSKTVTIQYENNSEVKASSQNNSTTIRNVYSSLPSGYRYTAVLTLTKKVVDNSGAGEAATDTFYAGIYRKADYSDTPTIVKFELNNKSSASVTRRILLPGKTESGYSDVTYYIAEVDSTGKRLTDTSDFAYNISISSAEVTLGKGDSKTVTITNEKKISSKVTLYLTKRVYEGNTSKKVTETFYAGLFKDSSFTQPYTKPIPLSLKDKSEMTLKLSLNLGQASEATIYVAEVDADGNVITDQQGFGYEIKMVNSTAAFTAQTREVRSVLLNSVYGTSTQDDWQNIVSDNDWGDASAVSGNGEASAGTASPQTGDSTPVGWYLLLMAAAFAVFAGTAYRRKKQ